MIRVNLLPEKRPAARRATSEAGQGWLAFVLGAVVLEILALLFLQNAKQDDLAKVKKQNDEVQASVDDVKRQTANHDDIKAQLKDLRAREDAIQNLQNARTGPTAVLLELSHILTPGRLPTVDRDKLEQLKRDNPSSVPNPAWDARRLWVTNYDEIDRVVKLSGLARDGEDISEFVRRLSLSEFFYDVRMLPGRKTQDDKTHVELVAFDLSTKVRY